MKKFYGWKPDHPDHRDLMCSNQPRVVSLPSVVNRLTEFIPAYDQGNLGSCTGNGVARIFAHRMKKEFAQDVTPSRLFIYYNERAIEHTIKQDAGAQVRDGLKAINKFGVCPESEWPYRINWFAKKPSKQCYTDAIKHTALQYHSVSPLMTDIKSVLAGGDPVVFGFTVFESFESDAVAKTGIMPMPKSNEQIMGGHCVVIDGYDDSTNSFWCANSWGQNWGIGGWFKMPYENLKNCSDFWVLKVLK